MKACIYTAYGTPEVVRLAEIPTPTPKANEVLIKIHATTVNRTDCGFRSAEYFVSRFWSGLFKPKFPILGCEFAGEVVAIGNAVTLFKKGDKVFGYNDATFGGHAEYLAIVEQAALTTLPKDMDFATAAAMTEGSHYALCNIRASKIKKGQNALVYGATGAIGSAAVQLLKYFGAKVTAVCSTPNVELVKSLGADEVLDYLTQDFTQTSQRFDFVFDAVGKSSFGQCKPIMQPQSYYISTELGKNGENIYLALMKPFLGGKKVLFPIPSISKEDVVFLKELAEQGKFLPVIDRKYSLEQIVTAYHYVESKQKIGNVVIQVV